MNLAAVTENQKNSDLKKLTEKFLFAALSCQEFTLLVFVAPPSAPAGWQIKTIKNLKDARTAPVTYLFE